MARHPYPGKLSRTRGFALMALLVVLTMGSLFFVLGNLTPIAREAARQQATRASLEAARAALLGYALRYREDQQADGNPGRMIGYLPLPDLGSSRNNNPAALCTGAGGNALEGCDAAFYSGIGYTANGSPLTLVGRFPWRTLGTGPLRDGDGECLWLMVSASHGRILRSTPPATPPAMNGDTPGQLDLMVADAADPTQLIRLLADATAHARPLAIVFAPGAALPGQDRSIVAGSGDDVSQCGGNYRAANYLDPCLAGLNVAGGTDTCRHDDLAGVANYFAGTTNQARDPDPAAPTNPKAVSARGPLHVRGDDGSRFYPGACPPDTRCTPVANDTGVSIDADALFDDARGATLYRTDINALLDGIAGCLDDMSAAGTPLPFAANGTLPLPASGPIGLPGYSAPTDKLAGRLGASPCYDDSHTPLGYFSNYQEQLFLAQCTSGDCQLSSDNGAPQNCAAVLIYADARSPISAGDVTLQRRDSDAEKVRLGNYLEGDNLASFSGTGTRFAGDSRLRRAFEQTGVCRTGAGQRCDGQPLQLPAGTAGERNRYRFQDIVRCIRSTPRLVEATSPTLAAPEQLVAFDPATGTLTLGKENITSGAGFFGEALFGCAWQDQANLLGKGFRAYFTFDFATVGSSVGSTGFTFAAVDAARNGVTACGESADHLGYSGNHENLDGIPPLRFPKLAIEFDQSRNSDRRDPPRDGSTGCNVSSNNTHAAIVYWGNEVANTADLVLFPDEDDNVHGTPTPGTLSPTLRLPPTSPSCDAAAAVPGIKFFPAMRTGGNVFHVRVEVTPTRLADTAQPELSRTMMKTEAWIELDSASASNIIAAMKDTTRPMRQLCNVAAVAGCAPELAHSAEFFDVAQDSCSSGICPAGQHCGTDNVCYRAAMETTRLGFTASQSSNDERVTIRNLGVTWPE